MTVKYSLIPEYTACFLHSLTRLPTAPTPVPLPILTNRSQDRRAFSISLHTTYYTGDETCVRRLSAAALQVIINGKVIWSEYFFLNPRLGNAACLALPHGTDWLSEVKVVSEAI